MLWVRHRAMRRLRVLTLLDNPDVTGGGERMAVTIAMRLDPERFERTLVAVWKAMAVAGMRSAVRRNMRPLSRTIGVAV